MSISHHIILQTMDANLQLLPFNEDPLSTFSQYVEHLLNSDLNTNTEIQAIKIGEKNSFFQAISFKLADMATKIEAGELLTMQAADLKNKGKKVTKESAIAKYYTSEISVEISTDAIQVFGGYGYTKEFPVEKFYRDSKLCTIGEGTSEIQKLVIARDILK